MNIVTIETNSYLAEIAVHGAELKRLQSKQSGRNYIYGGNGPWKRSSPVLFPNIGGLAEEIYSYDGKDYPAPAHGFARDMDFLLVETSSDQAVFLLTNSEQTETYFPFAFGLKITYTLTDTGIRVTWEVENRDSRIMYFSIGAHPGFALLPDTKLHEYKLEFDSMCKIETRRVKGRYLTKEKEVLADTCNVFPLSPYTMEKDAIILEDTGISKITLSSSANNYCLQIEFPDFPVVAVWTEPSAVHKAQFICLEPWCGINDLCGDEKKDISEKERVTALPPADVFKRSYTIAITE